MLAAKIKKPDNFEKEKLCIDQLIIQLEKLTNSLIYDLDADRSDLYFKLEQREKILNALSGKCIQAGPIEPEWLSKLIDQQKKLEGLIAKKLEQTREEMVHQVAIVGKLKKYNLKNVS